MKVAVVNLKGGTGKTTSAVMLACGLAEFGPTLLVDADPQGSALRWAEGVQFPFPTMALPSRSIHRELPQLGNGRHVIIDTPPGDLGIVTSALRSANVVLVPIQPTTADLDKLAELVDLIADVAAGNEVLQARYLLTRVTKRTRSQRQARAYFDEEGLPLMQAEIAQSQGLALAHGQPVRDLGGYQDVVSELRQGVAND